MGRRRKVLIALDATDEADEILEGALGLDPRNSADIEVITIIPPIIGGVSGMDGATFAASWPLREMEETIVRETTENIRERAAGFGIEPDQVVTRVGRPAVEIRAHAKRIDADRIVIGSHGRHGLPGVLLGSTANGVVHGAPCDVLTIRVAGESTHDD